MTNTFWWCLYASLSPTGKLQKDPGVQELKLNGSWKKGNRKKRQAIALLLNYHQVSWNNNVKCSKQKQGLVTWAIPTAGKSDALSLAPTQHSDELAAYWPRQFPVLPKPTAIPGSTFPVWQTNMGGTGMTKARWHYRQSSRQTCRCQWVFTAGNVMMQECCYCQWRQQVTALEMLLICLQCQLFPTPFSVAESNLPVCQGCNFFYLKALRAYLFFI